MQVYSLLGFVDYEGQDLLGVFGSLDQLQQFIVDERVRRSDLYNSHRLQYLGFDSLGYVVSELGQSVDVLSEVVYL